MSTPSAHLLGADKQRAADGGAAPDALELSGLRSAFRLTMAADAGERNSPHLHACFCRTWCARTVDPCLHRGCAKLLQPPRAYRPAFLCPML